MTGAGRQQTARNPSPLVATQHTQTARSPAKAPTRMFSPVSRVAVLLAGIVVLVGGAILINRQQAQTSAAADAAVESGSSEGSVGGADVSTTSVTLPPDADQTVSGVVSSLASLGGEVASDKPGSFQYLGPTTCYSSVNWERQVISQRPAASAVVDVATASELYGTVLIFSDRSSAVGYLNAQLANYASEGIVNCYLVGQEDATGQAGSFDSYDQASPDGDGWTDNEGSYYGPYHFKACRNLFITGPRRTVQRVIDLLC